MSIIYKQLARNENAPDDQPAESPDTSAAPGTGAQLELTLPGVPSAPLSIPPRARRARQPAAASAPADKPAQRDLQAKLTEAQVALALNEETIGSLRRELAAASETRQVAPEDGLVALQKELQALKDQNVALGAERDRIQQSCAELRAKAQPPPDLRAREKELDRQRKEIEGRIREADATAKQARQALEAEQRLRNEERQQTDAREQELNAQLLATRRTGPRSGPAISGRSKQMRIGTVVVVAMLAVGIGIAVFLSNRPRVSPSGDIEPMVEAMPVAESKPAAVPASVVAQSAFLPTIGLKGLQTKPVGEGLQIIFDNGVFSRRAIMSDQARAVLKELAWQLRPAMPACRLEITGHTDPEIASDADAPDNKALGYQRARAVAEYLAEECALPADAISVASAGDANAPYPNTTPELRRKNRTVTLVVIPFKE